MLIHHAIYAAIRAVVAPTLRLTAGHSVASLALAGLLLASAPLARAEDFSTDVSARWARRVVGQNAAPQGVENIQGSSTAVFQNQFDVTVSGGNLIGAIPNNDGTNDAATAARDTAIVVADSSFAGFPADNATFYAGTLLGNLTNHTLQVTFQLDTTHADGSSFTANDFWGDKFGFTDSATPPDGVRNMVALRSTAPGAPTENWWLAEGATLDTVATLKDGVYYTYSVDLGNKSLFNAVSGSGNATLFPSDFDFVMSHVSEIRFTFGSGFGALAGYAFAQEGPTGTVQITEFTSFLGTPEPASLLLAACGICGLLMNVGRRRAFAGIPRSE